MTSATFRAPDPRCPSGERRGAGQRQARLPTRGATSAAGSSSGWQLKPSVAAAVTGLRRPLRRSLRWWALWLLLSTAGPPAAAAGSLDEIDDGRVAAPPLSGIPTAVLAWRVSRSALPVQVSAAAGGLPGANSARVVQIMVWTDRPVLQLGLGVEQRLTLRSDVGSLAQSAPGAAGAADAGLLVGLRLDAGPRAHLAWQAPLWRPDATKGEGQARQLRVALALLPSEPYADLRRGLLTKVELSGQTTQALRPRGGRIGLLLNNHW